MSEPVIRMEKIVKTYYVGKPNELEILHGIDLTVNQGEFVSIVGESGSGKSTLLRCITQLETIDKGEIVICGDTLVKTFDGKAVYASKEDRHKINMHYGLVFQNFNLFPQYTALQNITLAGELLDFAPVAFEVVFPLYAAIAVGEWSRFRSDAAFEAINAMTPEQVRNTLLKKLSSRETKAFLAKVLKSRERFSMLG